jgi:hypothetical protein
LTVSTSSDREHLVTIIVNHVEKGVTEEVKTSVIDDTRPQNETAKAD